MPKSKNKDKKTANFQRFLLLSNLCFVFKTFLISFKLNPPYHAEEETSQITNAIPDLYYGLDCIKPNDREFTCICG